MCTVTGDEYLAVVRYASSMKLHVTLQSESNNGRIYPPYLEITYSHVDVGDRQGNGTVTVMDHFVVVVLSP